MIVTRTNFDAVLAKLSVPGTYILDTETTGLCPYQGDSPFSICIGTVEERFYFNFIPYPGPDGEPDNEIVLSKPHKEKLKKLLKSRHHRWVGHNMKFDMHMCGRMDLYPGNCTCTMIRERVLQNDRFTYSLGAITGEKSDAVKSYIRKHKLFTVVPAVFANKDTQRPHYDRVPLEIIHPYGETDVEATAKLFDNQEQRLAKMERIRNAQAPGTPPIQQVLDLEDKVLRVVFNMEKRGILVDRAYAVEAYEYERHRIQAATAEFEKLAGIGYDRREAVLGPLLEGMGHKLGRTKDGSHALDADSLANIGNAITDSILTIRDAEKRAFTFWAGILERLDNQNRLHADFKQAGTATGRFSCADPNLQNLPKRADENAAYPIRKAFIPPPGYCLYMPDYEQMEYRLFMDAAGQMDLIQEVIGGKCVHTATAEMIGRDRATAKTVNFMLIYGGGAVKLSLALKVPVAEAKGIKESYLNRLPEVRRLIQRLIRTAEQRGWLINWYGRPIRFTRDNSYTAPNHWVQGGCADVVKLGMVRCDDMLRRAKSHIVSQIHDELWFYMHESELDLAPRLADLMATAYPFRFLPMAVDPSFSWLSAHDKESGFPTAREAV